MTLMNFIKRTKKLDPTIWGKHYWFFLHTVAYKYPEFPNAITKRKYYDLINNFPLFIPDEEMGDRFASLLDKYPVTPYLDTRESFIRWCWFIHNKINRILEKEEIEFYESIERYFNNYNKPTIKKGRWVTFLILFTILILIIFILSK